MVPRTLLGVCVFATLASGCSNPPRPEPLVLDGPRLTVSNQTDEDWTDVEIWLNTYYRMTAPYIAAGSTYQTSLNSFVTGYAQRYDLKKAPVTDLRLTAKRKDGTTVELKYRPAKTGLSGALEGVAGGKK
jgi:hypothetical protein